MRVKITYSVEFDEVPKIVNEKLTAVGSSLENCGRAVKADLWDISYLENLENIDRVRKQLAALDAQLEDCYSILAGYNKALADMKLPAQEQHEQQTGEG